MKTPSCYVCVYMFAGRCKEAWPRCVLSAVSHKWGVIHCTSRHRYSVGVAVKPEMTLGHLKLHVSKVLVVALR